MEYSRKAIFDALTCDSSAEGCDPDWRHEVLSNASQYDVRQVMEELSRYSGELPKETELRLGKEGKFR